MTIFGLELKMYWRNATLEPTGPGRAGAELVRQNEQRQHPPGSSRGLLFNRAVWATPPATERTEGDFQDSAAEADGTRRRPEALHGPKGVGVRLGGLNLCERTGSPVSCGA